VSLTAAVFSLLSQTTENRKVEARKPLIFRGPIFGFYRQNPTLRQSPLGLYAQARESVVCNTGYKFSVILLIPQSSPRQYLSAPSAMLRCADITGRALEYRRGKMHEDSGVFLRGSRGQRGALRRGWYGKFAGILQGKIRQRVSSVRILMTVVCEGNIR
jgi:hypothetical protein